jgi:hypothetical protein
LEWIMNRNDNISSILLNTPVSLKRNKGNFYLGFHENNPGIIFASKSQLMSIIEETELFNKSLSVRFFIIVIFNSISSIIVV